MKTVKCEYCNTSFDALEGEAGSCPKCEACYDWKDILLFTSTVKEVYFSKPQVKPELEKQELNELGRKRIFYAEQPVGIKNDQFNEAEESVYKNTDKVLQQFQLDYFKPLCFTQGQVSYAFYVYENKINTEDIKNIRMVCLSGQYNTIEYNGITASSKDFVEKGEFLLDKFCEAFGLRRGFQIGDCVKHKSCQVACGIVNKIVDDNYMHITNYVGEFVVVQKHCTLANEKESAEYRHGSVQITFDNEGLYATLN